MQLSNLSRNKVTLPPGRIMNSLNKLFRFSIILSCILYISCITNDDDGRGTEVENEILGKIVLTDGSPAVGAKVRIYPVEYNPAPLSGAKAPDTAITNVKGEYTVKVPTGSYNILTSSNSLLAYSDSVNISEKIKSLPTDTLNKSGSITGYVELQPIHLPTNAIVELVGTNYFSNVDLSGKFYFPSLAAGKYTVRVSVDSKLSYTSLYTSFSVESGNAQMLSDTLRPQYNGIPVVRNIKAVYDSVQGIVRVSWDPIQYSLFRDYQIYRDPSNYITLSTQSIGRSKATTYIDTIYKNGVSKIDLDQSGLEFEYRVVARNLSNDSGSTYERATVKILPLTSLTTQFKTSMFSFFDEPNNTVLAGDTLKIAMSYHNDTRILDSIVWQIQGNSKSLRSVSLNTKNGLDTLVYFLPLLASPQTESSITLNVKIKDKQGEWWSADPIKLKVYDDRPILDAGKDTIVARDTTYTLRATIQQRYRKVDKWEWDIGGTGKFIETSGPDTTIRTPNMGMFGYKCVVRGSYAQSTQYDTTTLTVSGSKYYPITLKSMSQVVVGKNVIFLDQQGIKVFDILLNTTTLLIPYINGPRDPRLVLIDSLLYALPGNSSENPGIVVNINTKTITAFPGPEILDMVFYKNYIIGVMYNYIYKFNMTSKSWDSTLLDNFSITQLLIINGKLYGISDSLYLYNDITDKWNSIAKLPKTYPSSIGIKDRLVLVGGFDNEYSEQGSKNVFEFNFKSNNWLEHPPFLNPLFIRSSHNNYPLFAIDNNIYSKMGEVYILPE